MSNKTFISYLSEQKRTILIATGISVISFILLKLLFPYPDMFVDSTNYILWAINRYNVAYRPTGYSDFLFWTHFVSANVTFTVFMQYLLFFLSSMFCFVSADYLYAIPAKFKLAVLLFVLLNPVLLLQTNLISSDSVFCSTTVVWFTLCLWLVCKPTWWMLFLQIFLLYLCFEIRYTAMFFPVVAIIAFIFCNATLSYKIAGTALTILIIFFCVERQKQLNKELTDADVFSGFSGWQMANNVLYCYKHVNVDNNDLPSVQLQALDKLVKRYIDTVGVKEGDVGSAYIWHNHSPLKLYCRIVEHRNKMIYSAAWFNVSPDLEEYGWYIIKHFPGAYLRYYILPNTIKYFYPDLETLENYNSCNLTLPTETKKWYAMDITTLECRVQGLQKTIILLFPALSMLLNLFNISVLFVFIARCKGEWRKVDRTVKLMFITWATFYCCFVMFSIFATAVNLRFMDPIFVLGVIVPVMLLNYSARKERMIA